MRLTVIVCFLDEAALLPRFLASMAAQTRPPDRLLLVDDGSTDGSDALVAAFAADHAYARVLHRPARAKEKDRLATAGELKAFQWAVEQLEEPFDVVCKMDADLELRPRHLEQVLDALEREPRLGIVGAYLAVVRDGRVVREPHRADHVRGPNKFYRRECFDQVFPLRPILGWDATDELKARMLGWQTRSIGLEGGDSLHLRPTGEHDGRLRAFRRWGVCLWGFGAHPVWVPLSAAQLMRRRPYVLGGLNVLVGWAGAALRRAPRAEPDVVAYTRREQLARLRGRVGPAHPPAPRPHADRSG